jgi:hypothetical protein
VDSLPDEYARDDSLVDGSAVITLFGTFVLAVLVGWRPSNRIVDYLFTAPLLSVSALAWASGNPFNGATFAALALFLIGNSDAPLEGASQ